MRILVVISLVLLTACSDMSDNSTDSASGDKVRVRAGAFSINQSDLDFQAARLLSDGSWSVESEKALLDSMALTAAMASQQQSFMTAAERAEVDTEVKLYRMQLLAKQYMLEHLPKRRPGRAEVENYYQQHKASFGQPASYKVVEYRLKPGCSELGKLAKQNQIDAQSVVLLEGHSCVADQLTERRPVSVIKDKLPAEPQLQVGYWVQNQQTTSVWVLDQFHASTIPPLADVAAEIRQRLAPLYLKQSLQQARETLNKDIEYLD